VSEATKPGTPPAGDGGAKPAEPRDPAAEAAALAAFEAEIQNSGSDGGSGNTGAEEARAEPPPAPAAPAARVSAKDEIAKARGDQPAAKAAAPAPAATHVSGGMKPLAPAPEGKPPVVLFDKVTKRFGDFTAIKDVSFAIEDHPGRGEFVSILGPSGCGKSTVIRMIAGLTPQFPHTQGRVLVDGKPITGPGADRGMVFQDYTSFDNRSVEENIAFGLECRGVGKDERLTRAREWIQKVGLSVKKDADKYPHQLSGGMRQRVAIARTLILEPRIILMDEPFGALDPPTRTRMQDNLVELWREQSPTIFFITHSIEEAVFLGDHILLFSSSPGTVLKTLRVPPPDRPSLEMQRDPKFVDIVRELRDVIDRLESSNRAGD
jgi:NitT/TauT family transport system ATP-binding protein